MKRMKGREGLREAHGENPSQDEFLRLAGPQTPEDRHRLHSVSLH